MMISRAWGHAGPSHSFIFSAGPRAGFTSWSQEATRKISELL